MMVMMMMTTMLMLMTTLLRNMVMKKAKINTQNAMKMANVNLPSNFGCKGLSPGQRGCSRGARSNGTNSAPQEWIRMGQSKLWSDQVLL
jgi:hypothetical protein